MYYYIVDPPEASQTPKIAQRLQEIVTPMGISGEISIATPARSAEELTCMGLDKGYTTIVAVGGERLANTIATIIMNETREKIAFGIIPIQAGNLIPQMIGVGNGDIRTAAEIIKQRHLDLIDIVQLSTKRFMFTEGAIIAPRQVKMTFEVDQTFQAHFSAEYIHISNQLVLTVHTPQTKNMLQRTLSIIGLNNTTQELSSQFHGHQIRIIANEPIPIVVADEVVAKTPTTLNKISGALRLITPRAILPQKSVIDLPSKTPVRESAHQSFVQ